MTTLGLGLRTGVAGVTVAVLLALSGCAGDDTGADSMTGPSSDSTGAAAVTHDADIQPIWDAHCVGACHEAGGEWPLLDMSDGEAYDALVNGMSSQAAGLMFVEAGDTNMSYLWHKINGTQASAGGGGVDMPKPRPMMDATVMTAEEISTVEDWINAGAPQ